MLRDILKELSIAKVYSAENIAKKMNTTETLVEEALGQLVRMGYITEDMGSPDCDTPCGSCPMASLCNTVKLRTINITAKGKKLLKRI